MKTFNAKAHIQELNALRSLTVPSTSAELREDLKMIGLPSNGTFWTVLANSNLVKKLARNKYVFIDKPIHYTALETVYKAYTEKMREYAHNKVVKTQKAKDIQSEVEIKKAIRLLQENGFQVFAPIEAYLSRS